MLRNTNFLLWINLSALSWFTFGAWAQHSPYSLQTAVDELHHWDAAKFPLNSPPSQSNYYRSAMGTATDQDYWDDDFSNPVKSNRHRLSKALAEYLEREKYDSDNGGMKLGPFNDIFDDKHKKRSSSFRNDNEPSSIFRERETQTNNGNSELTEEFLREIEEAQVREREQRYKNALRHLWEKYQTQSNDVNNELFSEKKRMRVPPYYMLMSKKRSYPVLPWLPYNKESNENNNKRFTAVTKRSTNRVSNGNGNGNFDKTDERVERELSEMFGITKPDTKMKRSADNNNQLKVSTTNSPSAISTSANALAPLELATRATDSTTQKPGDNIEEKKKNVEHQHTAHGHDHEHEHKHKKRSNSHHSGEDEANDSDEEEEEDSEEHEHGDDHEEDEDDDEFGDEEDEQRKKKRDVSTSKTAKKTNEKNSGIMMKRKKKSIEWSKYFGIDRKKKSSLAGLTMKKRSTSDGWNYMDEDSPKHTLASDKLNNMDKKLQTIEDLIIDETIKYTGSHEGITNPIEIRRLKDHVLSRLATAYSLEKMRLALEKLRHSVDNENHLLRNVIEPEGYASDDENDSMENPNQPISKKEKNMSTNENNKYTEIENKIDEKTEKKQHMNKRTNYQRYTDLPDNLIDLQGNAAPTRYEPLNDMYLGNKNYIMGSNQCPIIERMAERCRGVDILSGDRNQELLPICGVHQICYLCGTSQISCDYQYLAEVDAICGNNEACQSAARSILMILRGAPGPQLGPRECGKSSCLYSAMREIGL